MFIRLAQLPSRNVRERAHLMGEAHRQSGAHVAGVELFDLRDAQQCHVDGQFLFEQFEHLD